MGASTGDKTGGLEITDEARTGAGITNVEAEGAELTGEAETGVESTGT